MKPKHIKILEFLSVIILNGDSVSKRVRKNKNMTTTMSETFLHLSILY
jgi:hypothetical protein